MKIVVMGPGLSLDAETQSLVQQLAVAIDNPLILDGDGITAVAADPSLLRKRKSPTVLTPHTGELCRLTGKERAEIENNRVEILQETAVRLNAFIVLKGPHTLIGCPDGRVFINLSGATEGKAGMATAGSGDVLNGTIAAMFCLGMNIEEAVRTGVFVHGLAGDMVAEKKGPDGMTAQDILDMLPAAVRNYRANINDLAKDYYGTIHTA
jgi:hydroxyethylthiazole kinase-like uncharacterized protein yjeF